MRTIFHVCADRGIDPAGTKGASIHLRSIATALAGRCRVVMLAARTSTAELVGDDGGRVERHFAGSGVFPHDLSLSPVNAEDQSGVGSDVEQVVDDGG